MRRLPRAVLAPSIAVPILSNCFSICVRHSSSRASTRCRRFTSISKFIRERFGVTIVHSLPSDRQDTALKSYLAQSPLHPRSCHGCPIGPQFEICRSSRMDREGAYLRAMGVVSLLAGLDRHRLIAGSTMEAEQFGQRSEASSPLRRSMRRWRCQVQVGRGALSCRTWTLRR